MLKTVMLYYYYRLSVSWGAKIKVCYEIRYISFLSEEMFVVSFSEIY